MKLSEIIRSLEEARAEFGDLETRKGVCFGPFKTIARVSIHRDPDTLFTPQESLVLWLQEPDPTAPKPEEIPPTEAEPDRPDWTWSGDAEDLARS
jgi:hypothetical protein